ncbi:MAG TPA: hypothetical protein V6C65_40105, partial [Allocoleopsis sp.]
MSQLYNEPKPPSKYASIFVMNWAEINMMVEVSELRYCKDDDNYYIYAFVETITNVIKAKDKDWKFEPQLMSFTIPRKPTIHKQGEEATHYLAERLVCYALDQLDESKCYKGFFNLSNAGFVNSIVSGVDMQGKPCPEVIRKELAASMFHFEETEGDKITAEDVKAIVKSKSWGSKGQTEAERLNDRVAFLVSQLSAAGYEVKSLKDV